MNLRTLLVTSVLFGAATAFASLETVAQRVATATGGMVQACPAEYTKAVCVRAEGSVVRLAGIVDTALPTLVPGTWRDGPAEGVSGDIPSENAVLHLVPRGEGQVLAVVQAKDGTVTAPAAAAAPAPLPVGTAVMSGVTVENGDNAYVVVLDSMDRPVRDLSMVREGVYTVVASRYGYKTQVQRLTVGPEGLKKLTVPRLVQTTPNTGAAALVLPVAPGYLFLVFTASGQLVTDLSALQPGYYDVFSYRDGQTGPLAGAQHLQAGQLTLPKFNGTFVGSVNAAPSAPAVAQPSAPSSPSVGQCWVNGYTRKNGTRVSGYYRRC